MLVQTSVCLDVSDKQHTRQDTLTSDDKEKDEGLGCIRMHSRTMVSTMIHEVLSTALEFDSSATEAER